jgi:predicted permease
MLIEILAVITPVFICAGLGFGWTRLGHPFDTAFVSRLVINIGAPCLLFTTFMEIEIERAAFGRMMLATMLTMGLFGLTGFVVLKLARLDLRSFLPSQMFPNVGNMGLPLCLLAFGEEGLALALTFFMMNTVVGFTFGAAIVSGSLSLRDFSRNPIIYTVIITVTAFLLDLQAPAWLLNTTSLLGNLTIPLMLLALGVSLGSFRIRSLRLSVGLSVLRLASGFLVSVGVAAALGLEGAARGILIMQSSMPIAVFSYLFALRYKRNPEEVAGTVVISTLLSFLTLPLLLWYVLPSAP